jgi:hypothetical protein
VHLAPAHGRLLVRPAAALAGLLEIRGLGIRRLPFEPAAVAGGVLDLGEPAAPRLPQPAEPSCVIAGIALPRLAVAPDADPLPMLFVFLREINGSRRDNGDPI